MCTYVSHGRVTLMESNDDPKPIHVQETEIISLSLGCTPSLMVGGGAGRQALCIRNVPIVNEELDF